MTKRSVIISSSGLKNIVLNKYQEEEDFVFVFGEEKILMKSFFAEFISPIVSRMHQTDPTINTINFGEILKANFIDFNKLSKSIITPDTTSLLFQISSGYSIEINEDQAIKMSILSNILGNEELHSKINELFPSNYNEDNINSYLKNIENFYHFPSLSPYIDFQKVISFIASHFYAVDEEEFLKIPRNIQYMIISDSELQIESEDWLFDIISRIIKSKKNKEEIDDILFLEQIELGGLSEDKFLSFMTELDFNMISGTLWHNLCQYFFSIKSIKQKSNIKTFKERRRLKGIVVAGYNEHKSLGIKPNNRNAYGDFIMDHPEKLSLDPSSLQSYSIYCMNTVLVTNNGLLKAIGYNGGRMGSFIQNVFIDEFTEFSITNNSDNTFRPISAVCCAFCTLYIATRSYSNERHLLFCHQSYIGGTPIVANLGNNQPIALFGGHFHPACILNDGSFVFINCHLITSEMNNSLIINYTLPNGEKASSIACCDEYIFVLTSNGRVFSSPISKESNTLSFTKVDELYDKEIICISGSSSHCLAVSKEGRVFGFGTNENGQLGLGEGIKSVSSFTEISSLDRYEIRTVSAGYSHSLFETSNGKVLSCGHNECGELLLSSGPSENIYTPTETAIKNGSTFCIAGANLSAVFVGINPPPNTPNIRI